MFCCSIIRSLSDSPSVDKNEFKNCYDVPFSKIAAVGTSLILTRRVCKTLFQFCFSIRISQHVSTDCRCLIHSKTCIIPSATLSTYHSSYLSVLPRYIDLWFLRLPSCNKSDLCPSSRQQESTCHSNKSF